jgi:hypothetical protein
MAAMAVLVDSVAAMQKEGNELICQSDFVQKRVKYPKLVNYEFAMPLLVVPRGG